MDPWTRYLHRDHSAYELEEWAQRLFFFRFCRAIGGYANDGDQLVVALRYSDPADLEAILHALGGARPNEHRIEIGKIHIGVVRWSDRILLSLFGAEGDPFQVTEQDVRNAELIGPLLKPLSSRVIDPPIDNHRCVAPKFYPEFWSQPRR